MEEMDVYICFVLYHGGYDVEYVLTLSWMMWYST